MKCYTWRKGELTCGIEVRNDENLGIIICLTEKAPGRRQEKVRRFPERPAEVKSDRIYNAHPVRITSYLGEQRDFFTLAKPSDNNDQRILVRVDTKWAYARAGIGNWETVVGTPENLVIGLGFYPSVKQVGVWRDGLILMSPGDVVRIIPEGRHRTPFFALFYEEKNGVGSMPFNDYCQIVADNRGEPI